MVSEHRQGSVTKLDLPAARFGLRGHLGRPTPVGLLELTLDAQGAFHPNHIICEKECLYLPINPNHPWRYFL
jgi:hypothetical protein